MFIIVVISLSTDGLSAGTVMATFGPMYIIYGSLGLPHEVLIGTSYNDVWYLPRGLSGQSGIVVAFVCPSVCLSVCKLYFVRTITRSQIWAGITKFAPNMHRGILLVGIENRGHWPWPSRSFWLRILEFWLVPTITRHRFGLESPNLHQTCILGYSAGIENGSHWPWPSRSFWPFWLRILRNLACPRNNF